MKLAKQALSLQVKNINAEKTQTETRHNILFPNTIRSIICGPSNCGKTNAMITLLLHENGVKFRNVYFNSKTSYQPCYSYLSEVFKRIPQINFMIFTDHKEIIHPNEALPNSIFIFDDVVCENQSNILNYFTMGRHQLVDCFYLSQTYTKIPKHLLRDNANFLVIFKQDDVNLKHIYDEHVNSDMEWSQFKSLCSLIWKIPYGFLIINKDRPINKGRYRQAFDTFIELE